LDRRAEGFSGFSLWHGICGRGTDMTRALCSCVLLAIAGCEASSTVTPPNPGTGLAVLSGNIGKDGDADGPPLQARFWYPTGVAADGDGNLYVADGETVTIRKIVVATGEVTTIAGVSERPGLTDGPATQARFFDPEGIALDGVGHLYIVERGNFTVRQLDLARGIVKTLAGSPGQSDHADGVGAAARFSDPLGAAADASYVYVGDAGAIRRVAIATGEVTTLPIAVAYTRGMWLDGAGGLYVANVSTVQRVDLATNEVTTIAGTDDASAPQIFEDAVAVAGDGQGNLFVADEPAGTVTRVSLATGATTLVAGIPHRNILRVGPLPGSINAPVYLAAVPGGVAITENSGDAVVLIAYVD
jgi:sugar lactone lactonase YvrE